MVALAGSVNGLGGLLKKITVPVLVMHGDDDQIVPYADSGPLSAQLVSMKVGGLSSAVRGTSPGLIA